MAVQAYVLISASQGKAREIAHEVDGIVGVREAHAVTGPYDVIACVEGQDINSLGETVLSRVQAIHGVLRTVTSIVVS